VVYLSTLSTALGLSTALDLSTAGEVCGLASPLDLQAGRMSTDTRPFRASAAIRVGTITPGQVRARCTRLLPDVYLPAGDEPTALDRAHAAWLWAKRAGVVAGWSAAAVHGARWVPEDAEGEVVVTGKARAQRGLTAWRWDLDATEVTDVNGMAVTTTLRTAHDLGRRLPLVEAVAVIDELCWMSCAEPEAVLRHAELHPGGRGVIRLRRAVALADTGSESPWETRARVAVVLAELPRPETQIEVFDEDGRFVARVDFGWRPWKVAVEYYGAHHRGSAQFARDLRRHNRLVAAGWTVIRVTAAHVMHPKEFLALVARALTRAGARW